ncbi:MAG: hypothetical protein ABI239_11255 [Aquihabitans sp.]
MAVLGPSGQLYVLRNSIGPEAISWVEELDPSTLEERHRSPDLALGPFWPGGVAVLDDGSILVVQGRWAHRLSKDLVVLASRRLPVEAPYNSFVLLADGTVATKDIQRPGGPPSTLSLLDPETLADRTGPVALPEASVARLSALDNELIVIGVNTMSRHRWTPETASLAHRPDLDAHYLLYPDQSFGWDAVVDADAIWWLDNGDHTFERTLSMLDNGVSAGPVRLWRSALDGSTLDHVEVCGLPGGSVTNPPLVDPKRGLVLGYDSANGHLTAFDTASLAVVWTRPINTAQHLMRFADTGEVIANDHHPTEGDSLVVLDIATGETRVRVPVESPAQSVVFGAPGPQRDIYYLSLSTIARVVFDE